MSYEVWLESPWRLMYDTIIFRVKAWAPDPNLDVRSSNTIKSACAIFCDRLMLCKSEGGRLTSPRAGVFGFLLMQSCSDHLSHCDLSQ